MGNSLQDQLLKAGLASEKQARKAKANKAPKKKKKGVPPELSEATRAAREAMKQKAERDRALNLQRKHEAERRASEAQVRQLVEQHRLDRDQGEIGYHFQDGTKVHKLYVTQKVLDLLGKGRADVVRFGDAYEVVPEDIARKIGARCADCVIPRNVDSGESAEDDPYKDFQVPDDLMW